MDAYQAKNIDKIASALLKNDLETPPFYPETERIWSKTKVSERTLRQTYKV